MTLTDPVYPPAPRAFPWEKPILRLMNDERDLAFVRLSLKLLLTIVPFAVLLYVPGMYRWWLAVPYFVLNSLVFLGPFVLMLHNTSHRPLFKRRFRVLNALLPWALGPFFGETPETYFAHHIGMHHVENNLADDLSSTLRFRRDNLGDFLRYFLRFFFVGWIELTRYHWQRRRMKLLRRFWLGEMTFYAVVAVLAWVNIYATLSVFVIPFVWTRLMMMVGNWSQHAFIDLATPESPYRNSITCVNSSYNRRCFNDGYHIGHHVRASMHWSEMPGEFLKNIDRYRAEKAIVFRKLDYFAIWALLMTHRYDLLSRFYVELDPVNPKSRDQIVSLLRERTRRPEPKSSKGHEFALRPQAEA